MIIASIKESLSVLAPLVFSSKGADDFGRVKVNNEGMGAPGHVNLHVVNMACLDMFHVP